MESTAYSNIANAILTILNRINKPVETDEIAFRVRSTPSIVREQLNTLEKEELVQKEGDKYSIKENKKRNLESIFNY